MIPVQSQWINAIEDIYRNPAKFRFTWFAEDPITVQAQLDSSSTYPPIYSEDTACFDLNLTGDYVASTENGRWLLDGKRHAACVNNEATEELWVHPIAHDYVSSGQPMDTEDSEVDIKFTWTTNKPKMSQLTIYWDTASNTYPEKVQILVNNVSITNMSHNTEVITSLTFEAASVNSITIRISSWSRPGCYARISEIILGEAIKDSDVKINNVEESKELSLINSSVPQYTCKVSIDNGEKQFDPLFKKGISALLSTGSYFMYYWELETLDGYKVSTPQETWKIISYEVPSDSTEVTINLGTEWDFMDNNYYPLEVTKNGKPTLGGYAEDILNQTRKVSGIFSAKYYNIPSELNSTNFSDVGVAPSGTGKEVMQQVGLACGYFLSVDYITGTVKLVKQDSDRKVNRTITNRQITAEPKISFDTDVGKISVNLYKLTGYTNGLQAIDTVTVNKNEMDRGSAILIEFGNTQVDQDSLPSGFNSATQYTLVGKVNNINITPSGALLNAESVQLPDSNVREFAYPYEGFAGNDTQATIAVNIKPYLETFTTRTYKVLTNTINTETLSVDNSFINNSTMLRKCMDMLSYTAVRNQIIELSYIGFPELEPGDIITAITSYGTIDIDITKCELTYNGGFTGKITGRVRSG